MTREEAIAILEEEADFLYGEDKPHNRTAFDMAIKALSVPKREKGEWILVVDREDEIIKENHWECSKCGSSKSGWGEYKFCPDCGADMRGKDNDSI